MRGVRALLLGVLLAGLAGCATVEVRETRVVTGQVTDQSGKPVAGSPVLVVGRLLLLKPMQWQYQERDRKEARTATGADGRYRLEFTPADLGNNFFLFFFDVSGFDGVKYRKPEPLEITDLLRRDRGIAVNQVLQFHPSWPEVERQIGFYGPASERARILRKHGLPDKRDRAAGAEGETEAWWYPADGVMYTFKEDTLIRTHTFQPLPTGAPAPKP
jgi:hypothetical protein